MRRLSSPVLLLLLLALGCRSTLTGYDFELSARYLARSSGFTLQLRCRGHVNAGEDVSSSQTGTATILPHVDGGLPVRLTFSGETELVYQLGTQAQQRAPWARGRRETLAGILEKAGYAHLDSAELGEVVRAVEGALGGPKGVLMEGQTKHLAVLETRLR